MAEEIRRDCEKMMDKYSLSYVRRFGHNLLHTDGIAELVLVILMGKITTSALENTNAAIKYLLDVLSTHVKTPLMATLAEVLLLRKQKHAKYVVSAHLGANDRVKKRSQD